MSIKIGWENGHESSMLMNQPPVNINNKIFLYLRKNPDGSYEEWRKKLVYVPSLIMITNGTKIGGVRTISFLEAPEYLNVDEVKLRGHNPKEIVRSLSYSVYSLFGTDVRGDAYFMEVRKVGDNA